MTTTDLGIWMNDVCVDFPIFENSHRSFKKSLLNLASGGKIASDSKGYTFVRALENLNLDFHRGDRIGLVGHNGSGKTTLLRTLAGIYKPTRGHLNIKGRVAALLDVSMGLDSDATGYENIYLRGVMEGLSFDEIREQVDEIAEFTGLGNYLNIPVRTYSSGMSLRLAFALSTSISADVIIMDEWLSVGDEEFSKKAAAKLEEIIAEAGILIVASHDYNLISRICNRCVHLESGVVVKDHPI